MPRKKLYARLCYRQMGPPSESVVAVSSLRLGQLYMRQVYTAVVREIRPV